MKTKRVHVIVGLVLVVIAASGAAVANDSIVTNVSIPAGQPLPIIEDNGVASGNIRLNYTYVGLQFPCGGPFARFSVDLTDQHWAGQAGVYPSILSLEPTGKGTPIQLSADPDSLEVSGVGWTGTSQVTINIDCSKLSSDPEDGDVIDGQMNLSVAPALVRGNAHIDTITTIQVHIRLLFPTACLKLYSFESSQETGNLLSGVTVNVNNNNGKVSSTGPGQISVDSLVANICSQPIRFDLLVGLDPLWETNPHGNSGNAVFTYTADGEFDPGDNLAVFGAGTPQGQSLCLSNVTLTNGDSFLTRVHSGIQSGINASSLPNDGNFDFNATLFAAGSNCSGSPLGSVDPTNPASSTLAFTTK